MRILYVSSSLPFGTGEVFIAPEVEELRRMGHALRLAPVRPGRDVPHGDVLSLRPITLRAPLLSLTVLVGAMRYALHAPSATLRLVRDLLGRGRFRIRLKNAAVLPKALWLAGVLEPSPPDHIHAHWAGTPSTLAMSLSRLLGTPWSFTCHLWDIVEDNLLRKKVSEALFCRSIDREGARMVQEITSFVPVIVHMGVQIPATATFRTADRVHHFVSIAYMVEKKGLAYLIEAAGLLKERAVDFTLDLVGDGPLLASVRAQVEEMDVSDVVRLIGPMSHDQVLAGLSDGRWHTVVSSSIVAEGFPGGGSYPGESEGIPVALIEAMGARVAAIGTRVGGVPELMEGAGVLVEQRNAVALADAMEGLALDHDSWDRVAEAGRARVEAEFDVTRIARQLGELMAGAGGA